jgi:cysteine desulfurase family protein (TIGR01976 family)
MPLVSAPPLEGIRAQFPALRSGFAFMDNAGGSQVPETVANAVRDYMLTSYVQVGASYPASVKATQTVDDAHDFVNTMFGGVGRGKAILGASTSVLCRMLSDCYAEILAPGDEVIVAESGHEANVNPWIVLASRGITVKVWEADPLTGESHLDDLAHLITARTKVIAFPHVSNILGAIQPVADVVEMARRVGARVVLDSVAYAPHQVLDVNAWGVDFCVYSCYKVFGPHMGALWGSDEALAELNGRNHPFIDKHDIPTKFELGGVLHEGCAGLLALKNYFAYLAGAPEKEFSRSVLVEAFKVARDLEEPLTRQLIDFLNSKDKVRIVGPSTSGPERVATISFLHQDLSSAEIVAEVDKHDIGMRNGNFYSWKLMERLGIPPEQGVARVSFAHYNSPNDVERLIEVLARIL